MKENKTEYPIISIVHHLSYLSAIKEQRQKSRKFFKKKYLSTVDGFIFNSRTTKKDIQCLKQNANGVVAYPKKDHIKPEREKYSKRRKTLCSLRWEPPTL
ncbi:hypothetical protein AKJ52_01835 [candidate division MSBL1 archaeon SCGC-AAA382C18]|uniref:Glycosyltransferase subfamily 4-like N-terminal domain-containing protein n=1 Tax=candidate division MSBL1 archaeon SCGC-AAA382C18 TaxID=1698281 RepID=A0A133VJQ9_9EURY|nr:hypothetical protein AKJ52_01835 [candidate division MSBL1 archaeon SCGC-AAA382C18]